MSGTSVTLEYWRIYGRVRIGIELADVGEGVVGEGGRGSLVGSSGMFGVGAGLGVGLPCDLE